jgi:hypothetical protein
MLFLPILGETDEVIRVMRNSIDDLIFIHGRHSSVFDQDLAIHKNGLHAVASRCVDEVWE